METTTMIGPDLAMVGAMAFTFLAFVFNWI
jgi:hypothetical protein